MGSDLTLRCHDCMSSKFTVTCEAESGDILIDCSECTASRMALADWSTDDPGF